MSSLNRPKTILHMLFDVLAVNVALFLAYYFRLGGDVFQRLGRDYFFATVIASAIYLIIFTLFRIYQRIWIYASYEDYFYGVAASLFAGMIFLASQVLLKQVILSLVILATILTPLMTIGGRIGYRALKSARYRYRQQRGQMDETLIVGDISWAMGLAKKMKFNSSDHRYPMGILTKDDTHKGRLIAGVPVMGNLRELEAVVREKSPKGIVLITESFTDEEKRRILQRVRHLGVKIETVTNEESVTRDQLSRQIKGITIDSLFGKKDIVLDTEALHEACREKRILVAGAAGVMGSRVSKTIAECNPEKLILLDVNENGLQSLTEEINERYPDNEILPVITSLNDEKGLEKLFSQEKPHFVFHGAFLNKSHLSEKNPSEVAKNNMVGTYHLVESAQRNGTEKLLMLSTNRTGDPKDLVSASKRICEMMLQGANERFSTRFSVVRFPDLGKNAYYDLDRFKKALEKGEPLRVKDPEEKKYLFGYRDAGRLIIKTMNLIQGGEVFVLNPGRPISAGELAEAFVSHQRVQEQAEGEMNILHTGEAWDNIEEPQVNFRELNPTKEEQIYTTRTSFDNYDRMKEKISDLELIIEKGDLETVEQSVMKALKDLIPTYQYAAYDGAGYQYPIGDVRVDSGKRERIWLSSPHMGGLEQHYVKEAFDTNWVAPIGPNVNEFEKEMAAYVGVKAAAAMTSGTAAIHIALRLLGVKQGDEVFCSSLTFSGSANPIIYEKAVPVFIDAEPDSWNISPVALEKALRDRKEKGALPKAIIVVNLYGQSADFDSIVKLSEEYGVPIIEDAAESLGATYKGRQTGTFGTFGVFSFNGNKIITTSGGGMLVSDDEGAIQKAKFLITQARDPARHYQHSELGFNYRMSNIVAGIGRGQLKILDLRVEQKKKIFETYKTALSDIKDIEMMPIEDFGEPNYWLSAMTIRKTSKVKPLDVMIALEKEEIESRPVWKPMHMQPFFSGYEFFSHNDHGPSVAKTLFDQGACLPSDTKMTEDDLKRTVEIIKGLWKKESISIE